MKGKRFQILLNEDLQVEAMLGKGSEICKFLQIYFFRLVVQFSEKLNEALYIGWHLYRRRGIIQDGASFITIKNLATFLGQNFQVFSGRDLEGNNF